MLPAEDGKLSLPLFCPLLPLPSVFQMTVGQGVSLPNVMAHL